MTEGVGEMFRNLVPALDNPSLSPNQGMTSVNFSQDEAVKAAGNTVSFVFRTKMFDCEKTLMHLYRKLNFIFHTSNILSSLFEYFFIETRE